VAQWSVMGDGREGAGAPRSARAPAREKAVGEWPRRSCAKVSQMDYEANDALEHERGALPPTADATV